MMYRIKVSGTEHVDDYHGKVSMTSVVNAETFYEVLDDMVISASRKGWTGITLQYQYINDDNDDTWHPIIEVDRKYINEVKHG